jgi:hypothetical protein
LLRVVQVAVVTTQVVAVQAGFYTALRLQSQSTLITRWLSALAALVQIAQMSEAAAVPTLYLDLLLL